MCREITNLQSPIINESSITNQRSPNWSRAGRGCLDSRDLLTNEALGHVGHNLRDKLVRRVRRQALDDATSHFVHETVGHSYGTRRRDWRLLRRGRRYCFALLCGEQRREHVGDQIAPLLGLE